MVDHILPPDPGSDVVLVPYDGGWPAAFDREERRIRGALGRDALGVHHVGSTSVPGLIAKPVIDVVLEMSDPGDEDRYVPPLEAAGYALSHREPEWYAHRLLKGRAPRVNLHVFPTDCPEVVQMLAFRDRLRSDDRDRATYAATKQALAARRWEHVQDYADAKSEVVADIMRRALPQDAGRG